MSENSFENSTYSENNSYDDVSSNMGESSLGSPGSDFNAHQSNAATAANHHHRHHMHQNHEELMSLPTVLTTSTIRTTNIPFKNISADAELSELLIRKQPKFTPSAPKCAKCEKSVYKAEEIRAANKTFHKLCFKCSSCNKLLEPNILTEHQGDLYYKNCYAKNFGPKGYGYGSGAGVLSSDSNTSLTSPSNVVNSSVSVSSPESVGSLKWTFSSLHPNVNAANTTPPSVNHSNGMHIKSAVNQERRLSAATMTLGSSDKCARCMKTVYAAERVNAAGKYYHKLCFNCSSCKKMLNSMNCCDNSEGEIFCKG